MIIDVTGIILILENMDKDCMGNGEHFDKKGNLLECCCDGCDYFICCTDMHDIRNVCIALTAFNSIPVMCFKKSLLKSESSKNAHITDSIIIKMYKNYINQLIC